MWFRWRGGGDKNRQKFWIKTEEFNNSKIPGKGKEVRPLLVKKIRLVSTLSYDSNDTIFCYISASLHLVISPLLSLSYNSTHFSCVFLKYRLTLPWYNYLISLLLLSFFRALNYSYNPLVNFFQCIFHLSYRWYRPYVIDFSFPSTRDFIL